VSYLSSRVNCDSGSVRDTFAAVEAYSTGGAFSDLMSPLSTRYLPYFVLLKIFFTHRKLLRKC
jgi:hypothetical protein